MIDFKLAKTILLENLIELEEEEILLTSGNGRVLSRAIYSAVNNPLFDKSAVDGYGISYDSWESGKEKFTLIGEIPAGQTSFPSIKKNECVRIFTGAAVPSEVDCIIMQEYSTERNNEVSFDLKLVSLNMNIRREGEQIKKGDIALEVGKMVNPTIIGFLSSLGIKTIHVKKKPRITLLITGNEFLEEGEDPKKGKIFESNGKMLQSQFSRMGFEVNFEIVRDSFPILTQNVARGTNESDIIIITGGVSVGDYDFGKDALIQNGFDILFHGVNQKPGKPLLFSKKNKTIAFGLPGNPRSVMVSFYNYVIPYIMGSMGLDSPFPKGIPLPLLENYSKKESRAEFLAGVFESGGVKIQRKQGSHMLQSLGEADCIIYFPEGIGTFEEGKKIEIFFINNSSY